jgi:hypothetical protein
LGATNDKDLEENLDEESKKLDETDQVRYHKTQDELAE